MNNIEKSASFKGSYFETNSGVGGESTSSSYLFNLGFYEKQNHQHISTNSSSSSAAVASSAINTSNCLKSSDNLLVKTSNLKNSINSQSILSQSSQSNLAASAAAVNRHQNTKLINEKTNMINGNKNYVFNESTDSTLSNSLSQTNQNVILDDYLKIWSNLNEKHIQPKESHLVDQWWQLFDTKTKKFYYYNAYEQKTSWHRPNSFLTKQKLLVGNGTTHSSIELNISNDKENNKSSFNNQHEPIVIPLACKLIERINTNLNLMKKSKKFLKLVRKKLDVDFKYDINDINIITNLTERLLNIQNILTQEESCSLLDLSNLEMPTPKTVQGSNLRINSSATSFSSLLSSYSFQSSHSLESNSLKINDETNKIAANKFRRRRLQPRTNPNYVNVDLIDTKNGSLIKSTYIKLQDLTNEMNQTQIGGASVVVESKTKKNCKKRSATILPGDLNFFSSGSTATSQPQVTSSSTSSSSFSTLSQAILLLLSLLTKTNTKAKSSDIKFANCNKEKSINKSSTTPTTPTTAATLSSSSSSMNTVCSLNNIYSTKCDKNNNNNNTNNINNKLDELNRGNLINDPTVSLCSSSATLISENSSNQSVSKQKQNNKKKKTFKKTFEVSISNGISSNNNTNNANNNNNKNQNNYGTIYNSTTNTNSVNGYSSSLTRKNTEKSNPILKTATTLDFTENNLLNSNVNHQNQSSDFASLSSPTFSDVLRPNKFSLFKKNSPMLTSTPSNKEDSTFADSTPIRQADNSKTTQSNVTQSPHQHSQNSPLTPQNLFSNQSILATSSTAIVSVNRNNLSFNKDIISASSSSSLADIRHVDQQQSSNQNGQFNQRLQTFKRSFNKKTSFKKAKSSVYENNNNSNNSSGNNNNNNNDSILNLERKSKYESSQPNDLNTSFESQRFPFESLDLDSPSQQKKPSQTNLFLNNTFIDLNTHHSRVKNGFLFFSTKKKVSQNDLLIWSNQSIQKPLIKTNDKIVKKEACELFKLIQIYMGDRKMTLSYSSTQQTVNSANLVDENNSTTTSTTTTSTTTTTTTTTSMTTSNNLISSNNNNTQFLNKHSQKDVICLEIMTKGWIYSQLRDELYLQIVKQTSENINNKSLILGWELMAICLSFFPPSQKLFPFLTEYICSHLDKSASTNCLNTEQQLDNCQTMPKSPSEKENKPTIESSVSLHLIESKSFKFRMENEELSKIARSCLKRLERIHITGAKKGLKKPTLDEILLSRQTITSPSLFGTTLEEIMTVQKVKCPGLSLPWIQTTLSEAVLRLNGAKTEGIFRVPGDLDEVNNLKVKYDQLWCSKDLLVLEDGTNNFIDLMNDIQDPHLPASLLKLWYRELYEPLIPNEFYEECIKNCDRPQECIKVIQKLPQINKLVFTYLIRFLKVFAASDNVAVTKMDANNLSMIMAPNCLRCKSNEPKVIMENTKKEMQFLNTLIHHLDTSIVQGIV